MVRYDSWLFFPWPVRKLHIYTLSLIPNKYGVGYMNPSFWLILDLLEDEIKLYPLPRLINCLFILLVFKDIIRWTPVLFSQGTSSCERALNCNKRHQEWRSCWRCPSSHCASSRCQILFRTHKGIVCAFLIAGVAFFSLLLSCMLLFSPIAWKFHGLIDWMGPLCL